MESQTKRNRNSILLAAGDVFNLTLNRRKRFSTTRTQGSVSNRPSNTSQAGINLDDVLEITADPIQRPNAVDDPAERERLRDAAALAVGLTQPSSSLADDAFSFRSSQRRHTESHLPIFPASFIALQPLAQNATALLKYVPSPSPFLALSRKQWRARYLVLTSTAPLRDHSATESHLHLFKSNGSDEKELERLVIHHESVVYIADEEVKSGRKFIIKVGGRLVDSTTSPEGGPGNTVWLLQLSDASQMQRWIQFIKGAVLMQRADRAGIGYTLYQNTYNNLGPELKGDLDVMLSMGKQGLLASQNMPSEEPQFQSANAGLSASSSSGAVSALRGLFNSQRPTSKLISGSASSVSTQRPSNSLSINTDAIDDTSRTQSPHGHHHHHHSSSQSILRTGSPGPNSLHSIHPFSPPTSPISAEDSGISVSSPTSTIGGSRYTAASPGRNLTHANSFSIDWDALDGGSMGGMGDRKINTGSSALAPPPRTRRPWTGGSGSSKGESVKQKREVLSTSASREIPSPVNEGDGEVNMEIAMGITEEVAMDIEAILQQTEQRTDNLSPSSHLHDEGEETTNDARMLHTPPMLTSSASSFGPSPSIVASINAPRPISRASTSSVTSDLEKDEEDEREVEEDTEAIDYEYPSSENRRIKRMDSIPRQISPSFGSYPQPSFRTPSPVPPNMDRRGSSSSAVPSLHPGLHPNRLSTMSNGSVRSVRSNGSGSTQSRHAYSNSSAPRVSSSSPVPISGRFPPARPAPSAALPLPPAPTDDQYKQTGSVGRMSYSSHSGSSIGARITDMNIRASRLSASPSPPPSGALPPRPDGSSSFSPNRSLAFRLSQTMLPGGPPFHPSGPRPAISSLPSSPPPYTPDVASFGDRSMSPSQLSTSSTRSTRSSSAVSLGRLPSLKLRLRMMSNPTPPSGTPTSTSSRLSQQIIPPAQPPPSFPPPAIPEQVTPIEQEAGHNELISEHPMHSYNPPSSPIGETITSRLQDHSFASLSNTESITPNATTSASMTGISSYSMTSLSYSRVSPQTQTASLSPPPRRNSRTSKDLTPHLQEINKASSEKGKTLGVSLFSTDWEGIGEGEASPSFYSVTPAKHSAINIPATSPNVEGISEH